MKLQADCLNGVFEVDDFDKDYVVIEQDTFEGLLSNSSMDYPIAAEVDFKTAYRIHSKYGIQLL